MEHPVALEMVSLDHVGPINYRTSKFWLLVIIDHATRYMITTIVQQVDAETTWRRFNFFWVTPFGVPRYILTDNGTAFAGEFDEKVTEYLGCKHLRSAPWRPQGNGINESSHRSFKFMLSSSWQTGYYDVDETVALATLVHNTTYHEALKMTPYEALFGRVPHIARCQAYYNPTTEEYRRTMRDTLAYSRLQKHYLTIKQIQPVAPTDIEVGDIVVVRRDPGGVADSLKGMDSPTWMEAV